MDLSSTPFRAAAMALSIAISTALVSTIVGSMPPDFDGAPNDARNGASGRERVEVAIVPSRIEVVGVRSEDTADSAVLSARPRS